MRCMGLNIERRRCESSAVTAGGYCELHELEIATIRTKPEFGADSQVGRIQRVLHLGQRQLVPDNAKFAVPAWLRKSATSRVINELHNPNTMVRWMAAFTLRKRRDPTAIDPLWGVLQDEPVSLVRQQAAVALGKIGTAAALAPLIEALWHDADAGVRQACAVALGNLGYSFAARDLAGILDREPAAFVRWDCVLALARVGDRALEPVVSQLADRERNEVIRNAYRDALGELRRRGPVG